MRMTPVFWALSSCTVLVLSCQVLIYLLSPLLVVPFRPSAVKETDQDELQSGTTDAHAGTQASNQNKSTLWCFKWLSRENVAQLVEVFFLSLAAAAFISDAMLHLIPEAMFTNEHVTNAPVATAPTISTEPAFHGNHRPLKLGLWCLLGMMLVLILERVVHGLTSFLSSAYCETRSIRAVSEDQREQIPLKEGMSSQYGLATTHSLVITEGELLRKNSTNDQPLQRENSAPADLKRSPQEQHDEKCGTLYSPDTCGSARHHHHHHHHGLSYLVDHVRQGSSIANADGTSEHSDDNVIQKRMYQSVAWTALAAMAIHNVLDGITIGVTFLGPNPMAGVATTISIFAHEVPSQLANCILLLRAGRPLSRAMLLNVVVACGVHVGAVGAMFSIPANYISRLQMVTAGSFLCMGLTLIVPQLLAMLEVTAPAARNKIDLPESGHAEKLGERLRTSVATLGLVCGVSLMTLLGLIEEA